MSDPCPTPVRPLSRRRWTCSRPCWRTRYRPAHPHLPLASPSLTHLRVHGQGVVPPRPPSPAPRPLPPAPWPMAPVSCPMSPVPCLLSPVSCLLSHRRSPASIPAAPFFFISRHLRPSSAPPSQVGWEFAPGEGHLMALLRSLALGTLAKYGRARIVLSAPARSRLLCPSFHRFLLSFLPTFPQATPPPSPSARSSSRPCRWAGKAPSPRYVSFWLPAPSRSIIFLSPELTPLFVCFPLSGGRELQMPRVISR